MCLKLAHPIFIFSETSKEKNKIFQIIYSVIIYRTIDNFRKELLTLQTIKKWFIKNHKGCNSL